MTNEQQQVREWMKQFGQETPEKPTIPDLATRKLRAKVMLEECLETCAALNMHPYLKRNVYEDDMLEMDAIGFWEDKNQIIDLALVADGCADQKVVVIGTEVACGLVSHQEGIKTQSFPVDDKLECAGPSYIHYTGFNDPLFNEVMRSNFSKLWTTNDLRKHRKWPDDLEGCSTAVSEGEFIATRVGPINSLDDRVWLVKDKDGKIIKSPSYSPPNLQPIIDEMSN